MSQTQKILNYLRSGHTITPIDALNMFGCFRLSGRIKDLRDMGYKIETKIIGKRGKNFAEYSLKREEVQRCFV